MSIVTTLLQKFGFADSLRLKFASARLTVTRGSSVTHLGHVYDSWESTRLSERFQAKTHYGAPLTQ